MVESAENWIGLHTINLHANTKYIQIGITLCLVNVYNHVHYIL